MKREKLGQRVRIDFHPSVGIIQDHESKRFLFLEYSDDYPRRRYAGAANCIGGNPSPDILEVSPMQTFLQEIREEFDIRPDDQKHLSLEEKAVLGAIPIDIKKAIKKDSILLRTSIAAGSRPHLDFYFESDGYPRDEATKEAGEKPHQVIFSVYVSSILGEHMDIVERRIGEGYGRFLVSEGGGLSVLSREAIVGARPYELAHLTPFVMGNYIGENVAHPEETRAEVMKAPLDNYMAYHPYFSHMHTMFL